MYKDFDKWNTDKKQIELRKDHKLFKTGEVWWCSVGINVGKESCGKGKRFRRPVLILHKLSHYVFIGIPLSTKRKHGSWFSDIDVLGETVCASLYQIRLFSTHRLQRRLTSLENKELTEIKKKLKNLLEL